MKQKIIRFAGFKIRVFTSPLIPDSKAYFFSRKEDAKTFIEILQALDRIINSDLFKAQKFVLLKKKPNSRIIRPS